MRVALLSRSAHPLHDPGGMERAVYLLAKHLQARGVDTVLVTRPATRAGTFPGRVVTVPYGDPGRGHGRIVSRTLHYPAFAARVGETVADMVRAGEVDIVDAQGLTALGYGRRRRYARCRSSAARRVDRRRGLTAEQCIAHPGNARDLDDVPALAALHANRATRDLLVTDLIFRFTAGAEELHSAERRVKRTSEVSGE